MPDAFEDSRARLERLMKLATEETDSAKQDELTTEIRRVLDERARLKKKALGQNPGQTLFLRLEDRKVLKLIERLEKQILQAKSLATGTKDPRTLAS
jgi:hypothetical protein